MILSKIRNDAVLFAGLAFAIFSIGGLLYIHGKYAIVKEQYADLTTKHEELTSKVATLETEKAQVIKANADNEAALKELRQDIGKAQVVINQTAQRNRSLQSTISRLQIEAAKGTDQDGEISPILADTLKSLPGATK